MNRFFNGLIIVFLVSLLIPISRVTCTPQEDVSKNSPIANTATPNIVEHRVTPVELEELKQEVGVWKEDASYNQTSEATGTGLRPPTEKEWAMIAANTNIVDSITSTSEPPSFVDHTTDPWFPPIGNQYGQGSCTAWAVGYYMQTYEEAKIHGWDLSKASWNEAPWQIYGGGAPSAEYQNRIMSPSFLYNLLDGGVDGGSNAWQAISLMSSIGSCTWDKMPYDPNDCTSWPSQEAWREAPLYRAENTGVEYLSTATDAGLVSLKNWIASGNLAVIGVDGNKFSNGLWSLLTSNDVFTLDNYQNPQVNHENTIVGYDDNIEYVEQGVVCHGAFKIANSWGKGIFLLRPWENVPDGCYWISYATMKQLVGSCLFNHDKIDYQPELVASFQIAHSKRGECSIAVCLGNLTKSFSYYVEGGNQPFCTNEILFDITEFKQTFPDLNNRVFSLRVFDGGSSTTGTITEFGIEYAQSKDTPIQTINGQSVSVNVTLPPLETNLRTVYFENAFSKPRFGSSWSNVGDRSSWSGIAMESLAHSSNGGCLFGPYIASSWDGESMLGKSYVVTFRLKVSSNQLTNDVAIVDVGYNAGVVLQSLRIKASDFASSGVWQDFNLTFIVPNSLTYGLEFRVTNLNNNVTDLYADSIFVSQAWTFSTTYLEGAYNKLRSGNSWSVVNDPSSCSGLVMVAASYSSNGGMLFGPYITSALDKASLIDRPYVVTFRLKVSSNQLTNDVAIVDVGYNAGVVLQSLRIKASDFASSGVWQDFSLTFTAPASLVTGLEFRVQNQNHGLTDLYADEIAVAREWNSSIVYSEGAYNKLKSGNSWSVVNDPSSCSGLIMKATNSSANGGMLYGPYITSAWDGDNMLGKPYVVSFRLKVSSNTSPYIVVYVDVCCDAGAVLLESRKISANDFVSPNTWQMFQLSFITPHNLTAGIEFRVMNTNNGIADIYTDEMFVMKDARVVYWEQTREKPQSGISWTMTSDALSWSGTIMEAPSSSSNGGCLFGPYIASSWDGESMLGKSYVVTFRLKVSSNQLTNDVAIVDVGYNAGVVLQSLRIKASDFASSGVWQDFNLTFIVPNSLTYGLEFRVTNLNKNITDLYADRIVVNTS